MLITSLYFLLKIIYNGYALHLFISLVVCGSVYLTKNTINLGYLYEKILSIQLPQILEKSQILRIIHIPQISQLSQIQDKHLIQICYFLATYILTFPYINQGYIHLLISHFFKGYSIYINIFIRFISNIDGETKSLDYIMLSFFVDQIKDTYNDSNLPIISNENINKLFYIFAHLTCILVISFLMMIEYHTNSFIYLLLFHNIFNIIFVNDYNLHNRKRIKLYISKISLLVTILYLSLQYLEFENLLTKN